MTRTRSSSSIRKAVSTGYLKVSLTLQIENHALQIDPGDWQMILLALSELSVSRPGWNYAIGLVADKLHGRETLAEFNKYSPLRERLAPYDNLCKQRLRELRELYFRLRRQRMRSAKCWAMLRAIAREQEVPDCIRNRVNTLLNHAKET